MLNEQLEDLKRKLDEVKLLIHMIIMLIKMSDFFSLPRELSSDAQTCAHWFWFYILVQQIQ